MRNERGLSLVELIVGLGVFGLVGLTTMGIVVMTTGFQKRVSSREASFIDKTIGERMLLLDLKNVEPSFNNMTRASDDTGQGFFDYYPDVASALISPLERKLTLDGVAHKEIVFLAIDVKAGHRSVIVYDPVAAFTVGPAPRDFNTPAALSYGGVNKGNWAAKQEVPWTNGNLYMLSAPAYFRPPGAVPERVPPRTPTFMGAASGSDLVADGGVGAHVDLSLPWDRSAYFTSADHFLRTLPSLGGGQPVVQLKSVKLIKYFVQASQEKNAGLQLFRQTYSGGKFGDPFLVSDRIKQVVFSRKNVTGREIAFEIEKIPER